MISVLITQWVLIAGLIALDVLKNKAIQNLFEKLRDSEKTTKMVANQVEQQQQEIQRLRRNLQLRRGMAEKTRDRVETLEVRQEICGNERRRFIGNVSKLETDSDQLEEDLYLLTCCLRGVLQGDRPRTDFIEWLKRQEEKYKTVERQEAST